MYVAELWRYPVKSIGGETLETCRLTRDGVPGDRLVHVSSGSGRVITSRSRPQLLTHQARLRGDGVVEVDGEPWDSPAVLSLVRQAVRDESAELVEYSGAERFDVLPLLLATDGAIEALGYDRRRFRPNILVGGVAGYAERTWEGRCLAIGSAVVRAVDLRQRCIMTTFDPDTAEQDVEVLRRIHTDLGGTLALNCSVEREGVVRLGDEVRLLPVDDSG